jgi:hypothetical protein
VDMKLLRENMADFCRSLGVTVKDSKAACEAFSAMVECCSGEEEDEKPDLAIIIGAKEKE